jgi:hypothetical protein
MIDADHLPRLVTLGVRAIVGRTFTAADDMRGGGPDGAVMLIRS